MTAFVPDARARDGEGQPRVDLTAGRETVTAEPAAGDRYIRADDRRGDGRRFLVISMQLRRMERRVPLLAILQFASGVIVTVVLMIPMLLFVGASFRPERAPELTMLVKTCRT